VVRRLARWHVPRSLSAGLLVSALVGLTVLAISAFAPPAEKWLNEAPRSIRDLQTKTLPARGKLADIQALADEVDELTKVEAAPQVQEVVVQPPGPLADFVGSLPSLLASAAVVVFLSYFLLASGDCLLQRAICCGRNLTERRRIVRIARHIQNDVSGYLTTVTLINTVLGIATGLALQLFGVPNPWLWGTMAGVLNFAPYMGALVSLFVLLVVGIMTFKLELLAFMVPGVFFALTVLEGQLITPLVLGRRMSLSPTVVFVSVIVWGWLWGGLGALMAVPIVTAFKVVCQHYPPLHYVHDFLRNNN
jgi:predicted PurR-regulated permease PerM